MNQRWSSLLMHVYVTRSGGVKISMSMHSKCTCMGLISKRWKRTIHKALLFEDAIFSIVNDYQLYSIVVRTNRHIYIGYSQMMNHYQKRFLSLMTMETPKVSIKTIVGYSRWAFILKHTRMRCVWMLDIMLIQFWIAVIWNITNHLRFWSLEWI